MTAQTIETPSSTWARVVSDVLSPPVVWGVLIFPITARTASSTAQALLWAAIYITFVCIMPALYIGIMVWRGHITDMHVRVREQRIRPYTLSVAGCLIACAIFLLIGAAPLVPVFAFFSAVQIGLILLITLRWQISLHSMSISAAVVLIGVLYGPPVAVLLSPLIPLVGAARIRLQRHTLAQVVGGFALGASVAMLMYILALPLLSQTI